MAVAAGTVLHPAVAIAVAEGTGLHPAVAIAVAEGTELRRAVVTEAGAIALHPVEVVIMLHPVADMEEAAAPPEEAAGDHPAVAVAVAVDIPGAAEAMLAVAIHVDVSSTEQVGQRGPEIMGQSVESQNNRVHDVTRGMAAERSKLYSRVHR
jgi:hypothetical protein